MRQAILFLTLAGAMLLACTGVVLAQTTTPFTSQSDSFLNTKTEKIPGSYIVVLKDSEDPDKVAEEKKQEIPGLKIEDIYKKALNGFSVKIPDAQVSELRKKPEVRYVEQDQVVTAIEQGNNLKKVHKTSKISGLFPIPSLSPPPTTQKTPWGIDRIDADKSSTQAGNGSGDISNVNVYVIDTGIDRSHKDLNIVSPAAVNYTRDGKNYDCAGHGTHVAGTIAAKDNGQDVVGVVPGAPITGVKVLNCSGSGTTSGVISGVEWVTNAAKSAQKPAIANMSLGGGPSQALDDAVRKSAANGVFYSIAAGNDGKDACNYSPARAGIGLVDATGKVIDASAPDNGVMTTGASDSSNTEASFSNSGSCVDVYGPGVSILSTKMGGGTTTMSGTSMAAPHVGGTGALYLSKNTSASAAVESKLKTDAGKALDGTTLTTNKGHNIVYAGRY